MAHMTGLVRRAVGVGSVASLLALWVTGVVPASAAVPGAVDFAHATFNGDSSGDITSVGAISTGATNAANVVQAFSGATTNTAGLTTPLVGDTAGNVNSGLLIQPTQAAAVKAYGTGTGLSAGLAAASNGSGNQVNQAGRAEQVAPPNGATVTTALPNSSGLTLPGGAASASALTGRASAIFDATTCPLGQPISYGLGNAANVSALAFSGLGTSLPGLGTTLPIPGGIPVPTTGSLINSAGVSQTDSETFLSSNGDGTYGVSTQARATIAPLTVNLFGAASLVITVGGIDPSNPLTFTASTTGEGSGAQVALSNNAIIHVQLVIPTQAMTIDLVPAMSLNTLVGAGGITIPLNLNQLGTALNTAVSQVPALGPTLLPVVATFTGALAPVLAALPNASFGSITLGKPPRAINSSPSAPGPTTPPFGAASTSEGTNASGAFDLARVNLQLPAAAAATGAPTNLANLAIGHFEAQATNAAPIICSLPVIKSANPMAVNAGDRFVYTIQVPDPAKLALLSCSLTNLTVVDTIGVASGKPTFSVIAASNGGMIAQTSPTMATVTFPNLTYTKAPVGQPPNPPLSLTITVAVPANSPSGVLRDIVNATGTAAGCDGGVSGINNLGGVNGNVLTGSFTLDQPKITAAAPVAPGQSATLPHTGGPGGLWQPAGGVAALGLGAAALTALRRSRRRPTTS